MPGDVRNDLYLTIEQGVFERGGKVRLLIVLIVRTGFSLMYVVSMYVFIKCRATIIEAVIIGFLTKLMLRRVL